MTLDTDTRTAGPDPVEAGVDPDPFDPDPFDLDITVFEAGSGLEEIIRMTDDGCGSTCESACNSCSS